MKKTDLRILGKLLKGLMDGTVRLQAIPTGKKPKKSASTAKKTRGPGRPAKPARRGRKPLKGTGGRKKSVPLKNPLPASRDVFLYLKDKQEGVRLTDLARNFQLKRAQMAGMVQKMIKNEDVEEMKGRLFLMRNLRKLGTPKERREPVSRKKIFDYLKERGKASLAQMCADFKESSHQRFNRVISVMIKADEVKKDGKLYSLKG